MHGGKALIATGCVVRGAWCGKAVWQCGREQPRGERRARVEEEGGHVAKN